MSCRAIGWPLPPFSLHGYGVETPGQYLIAVDSRPYDGKGLLLKVPRHSHSALIPTLPWSVFFFFNCKRFTGGNTCERWRGAAGDRKSIQTALGTTPHYHLSLAWPSYLPVFVSRKSWHSTAELVLCRGSRAWKHSVAGWGSYLEALQEASFPGFQVVGKSQLLVVAGLVSLLAVTWGHPQLTRPRSSAWIILQVWNRKCSAGRRTYRNPLQSSPVLYL